MPSAPSLTGISCAFAPTTSSWRLSALSVVVPGITAIFFPFKSEKRSTFAVTAVITLPPSIKIGRLKSTVS